MQIMWCFWLCIISNSSYTEKVILFMHTFFARQFWPVK